MAFEEARKSAFYAAQLGLGSEACVYYPSGEGAGRQLLAVIAQRSDLEADERSERQRDVIDVVCGADPEHAKGGVDRPTIGDRLQREIDGDDERLRYSFTGRVLDRTPHSWRLEFERSRVRRIGVEQRRGV